MNKITFFIGSMTGVGDCITLAKRQGMFDTAWGTFFFIFFIFIVGLCGGMTALLIKDWIKNLKEWNGNK